MSPVPSILALSIRQPWAELILSGRKAIEVRSWTTDYRGEFWVHAGKSVDAAAARAYSLENLFTGGYLGTVNLVAIVALDASRWQMWRDKHLIDGDHRLCQFAWILDSPRRLRTPLKAPGQLGLFRPDPKIFKQLAAPSDWL